MLMDTTRQSSIMTQASRTAMIWRWILVPCASIAAFYGALYFSLFVLFFGPFPKDLADPTAAFLMTSFIVLAGSFVAPRYRVVTALILLVIGALPVMFLLKLHVFGALIGGLVGIAFVAWWFHRRRPARLTIGVSIGAFAASIAFLGFVYARYLDVPARPVPLVSELSYALGTSAAGVSAFYRYDLGGFIDHEWLWRIDAKPDVVALVVSGLDLQRTNAVPRQFWQMPPHYWPRSMSAGAEAFQSSSFSASSRGPDGDHYFLLYDKTRERAFVWLKSNF
jgi:hypothetical protein